jgi:hypothetical protein
MGSVRRVYAVNGSRASSRKEAVRLRETFVDRPMERVDEMAWSWPKSLREVGKCEAVMYSSDKWKPRRGDMEDYKHVAEGNQVVYVRDGFLRDFGEDPSCRSPLRVVGPRVTLARMPADFAVLADVLGIQIRLYDEYDDEPVLGERYYQVDVKDGKLGAAVHPGSGDTFLLVYGPGGVYAIITGEKLDVLKDGIVG